MGSKHPMNKKAKPVAKKPAAKAAPKKKPGPKAAPTEATAEKPKHPGGRPSGYDKKIAATICARIADGQSVREIARAEDMPAMSTIFLWLATHKEFSEQYALACEARAHYLAEELLDVADDGNNDWIERLGEDGQSKGWKENGEAIQRSRLRVDTRKWLLSKLQPKKYGDRLDLNHGGSINARFVIEE